MKCGGAIARYYDAGMKINIEWIEEYNELVSASASITSNKIYTQQTLIN